MLISDFIKRLIDYELNHDLYNRYHPDTGEDMLGPCAIVVDVFDDTGYRGYSPDIKTFMNQENGDIWISAMANEYEEIKKWPL